MALACLGLITSGCKELSDLTSVTASTDTRRSFPAMWVSASWSGGKTGTPLTSRSVAPTSYFGALCPATSLLLENHTTRYAAFPFGDILLITNNCTAVVYVAVCRTAGTGGQPSPSIPLCGTDPRLTSANNFNIQRLSANQFPNPFGNTGIALDIEIFWCSDKSDFNFDLAKPKAGAAPTDCVDTSG